jgi:hypothetical protein
MKMQAAERKANEIRGIKNILSRPSQTNAVAMREVRKFKKRIGGGVVGK